MSLKWGKEKIKGFSSPVKTAGENNDWIVWAIMAVVSLSGIGYFVWQIIR